MQLLFICSLIFFLLSIVNVKHVLSIFSNISLHSFNCDSLWRRLYLSGFVTDTKCIIVRLYYVYIINLFCFVCVFM